MHPSMGARGAVTILLLALLPAACTQGNDTTPQTMQTPPQAGSAGPIEPGAQMPADHPPIEGMGAAPAPAPMGSPMGTVKETMNSAGYTYVLLDIEGEEIWAAGPVTALEVGDEVAIANPMGMSNFTASSLNRTFEQILFVSAFTKQ